MRTVRCDFCKIEIQDKDFYYRYSTGHLLCDVCDAAHGTTEDGCMFVRGESEWWDAPTETFNEYMENKPDGPNYEAPKQEERKGAPVHQEVLLKKGEMLFSTSKLQLVFTQETYNQVFAYVDASHIEISGLGRIKREVKDNTISFVVEEVFLLKQQNTSANTHLDQAALTEFILDRVKKDESIQDIKLWWHSHVNMGAFWSGTDDACCNAFENEGQESDNWYVSIVVNKSREMKARLDIYKPYRVCLDDIPVKVLMSFAEPDRKRFEDEVKEKCNTTKSWLELPRKNYPKSIPYTPYAPGLTDADIKYKYQNGSQETLAYHQDMNEDGKAIERLNYLEQDTFYKLMQDNPKVPTHKVPGFKNLTKNRNWYLDSIGNMCNKFSATFMKKKMEVSQDEHIIFYKRVIGCECEWCSFQTEAIKTCEGIAKKGKGEDAS